MAKRLTKGKRKYLVELVEDAAEYERCKRSAEIQAKRLAMMGFLDRQNRAYMAIYC